MALTVNLGGSLTVTAFSQKASITLNESPTIIGNNYVSNSVILPTGSWIALATGSNVDFRMGAFNNDSSGSYVYVALNQTASYSSILWPNDSVVLTYSGSAQVYVKAVGTQNPTPLTYTIASYN